jgi:arsenite methyltransferase
VGHSGHVDIVAILLLVLAVQARLARRPIWSGVFLAAATLVKFYAVAALPALLRPDRRRDPRLPVAFAATALLAYLPFLNAGTGVLGYLSGYLQEEGITSGRRFYLLNQAERLAGWWLGGLAHWPARAPVSATQGYEALVIAALGGLALWCWLRPLPRVPACGSRAIAGRVTILFTVLLVLTTPAYPWYTLLALACAPLAGRRALLLATVLTGSAGYLYLQWWLPGTPQWPLTLAYGGGALTLLLVSGWGAWAWLARRRAQTPDPGGAASNEPSSLFDRFPWLYALCREWLFRDHSARIARALWPDETPEPGSELIELGCGPGHYARHFAARYAGLRVTGIDRSPQQLRYARSRAGARRLGNCRFVEDDALALRRRANSTDVIVASRLFTILPERERAVREMHRVLRPGGRCFIAEPRSTVFTAVPLRALWLLAGVAALWRGERTVYREPRRATILTSAEFGALLATQPWLVRQWADRQYHFAVCEKVADIAALAAD